MVLIFNRICPRESDDDLRGLFILSLGCICNRLSETWRFRVSSSTPPSAQTARFPTIVPTSDLGPRQLEFATARPENGGDCGLFFISICASWIVSHFVFSRSKVETAGQRRRRHLLGWPTIRYSTSRLPFSGAVPRLMGTLSSFSRLRFPSSFRIPYWLFRYASPGFLAFVHVFFFVPHEFLFVSIADSFTSSFAQSVSPSFVSFW